MRLEVDPSLLHDTATHLRDAVAVAREVAEDRGRLGSLVAGCGTARARVAAEQFVEEWAYGMGLVVEDAERLAEMLEAGAAGYAGVERAIAGQLR